MGMFDYVEFECGNVNLPVWFDLDLQDLTWQTKDLHNCLYEFVVKNDRLHYRDSTGALHFVSHTGTIEIHAWTGSEEGFMLEYSITFKEGDLVGVGPKIEQTGLSSIPAMEEDNAKRSEAISNSLEWWKGLESKRPWHARLRSRLNAARWDFKESWRFLIRGFKRLLGISLY